MSVPQCSVRARLQPEDSMTLVHFTLSKLKTFSRQSEVDCLQAHLRYLGEGHFPSNLTSGLPVLVLSQSQLLIVTARLISEYKKSLELNDGW